MKLIMFIVTVFLFASDALAIEPFTAECQSGKAYRYHNGNGLTITGDKASDPGHGWYEDNKWWGKDTFIWNGGKTLSLNYGKMDAVIIGNSSDVLTALYAGKNDTYLITLDTNLGLAGIYRATSHSIRQA